MCGMLANPPPDLRLSIGLCTCRNVPDPHLRDGVIPVYRFRLLLPIATLNLLGYIHTIACMQKNLSIRALSSSSSNLWLLLEPYTHVKPREPKDVWLVDWTKSELRSEE